MVQVIETVLSLVFTRSSKGERLTVQGATSKTPVTGHLAKLLLTFGENLVYGRPGGGGVPPLRNVSVTGVFEAFPTVLVAMLVVSAGLCTCKGVSTCKGISTCKLQFRSRKKSVRGGGAPF